MDGETRVLLDSLGVQRAHVTGILDGLSDQALTRPVLPTGWTCAGLVQHLTLDVERFWFREVVAGEVLDPDSGDTDSAWVVGPGTPPGVVLDRYRAAIDRSDAIAAATPLDSPPAAWPDFFGDWRLDSFRQVLLHVITETACHAGHLDAARELLDGGTWLILP